MKGARFRVDVYDPEHEEFARMVFERHPPGSYLMDYSASDLVKSYFKMDKARWLEFFTHDYTVAYLRRDGPRMGALCEAYRRLAGMLDWGESEPWRAIEQEPMRAAEAAAKTLFTVYLESLRVDGWRARDGEALYEGIERGLGSEPSEAGDACRREFGRWMGLESLLGEYAVEARGAQGTDKKVTHWFACRLNVEARLNLYGTRFCRGVFAFRLLYLDCVLQNILWGGVDTAVEEALWHTYIAARECEDHRLLTNIGSLLCEDHLVAAMMLLEGVDRRAYAFPRGGEKYLLDLENRLGRRGLASAYRETLYLDPDFYEIVFKRESELTEEQRQRRRMERNASEKFLEEAAKVIREMLEKRGFRAKLYTGLT